jgi:hypothetical protein
MAPILRIYKADDDVIKIMVSGGVMDERSSGESGPPISSERGPSV